MILAERAGKAIRSPSKSALLAYAAGAVWRGRGFGVHKALDQLGAFAGPLAVAAVVAATGSLWPGFGWLVLPGVVAMVILMAIRRAVPDMTVYTPEPPRQQKPADPPPGWRAAAGAHLPGAFFWYALAAALTTGGLVTFAVISVHLTRGLGLATAAVPLVYAGAMLLEALAALVTGWAYDRTGAKVLFAVPILVALVPALAFAPTLALALVGVAVWAVAYGIQDSTIKALVADLVPGHQLASAYGIFAAIQGAFAILCGWTAGYLVDRSLPALVVVVGASQVLALVLLWASQHTAARSSGPS